MGGVQGVEQSCGRHVTTSYVFAYFFFLLFQLIYDVQDGGGSIGLISTAPQKLDHLKRIGVDIPTML